MLHSQGKKLERALGFEYALAVEEDNGWTFVTDAMNNTLGDHWSYQHSYGLGEIVLREPEMYGLPPATAWQLATDAELNIKVSALKLASVDTAIGDQELYRPVDRYILYSVAQNDRNGGGPIVKAYFAAQGNWHEIFSGAEFRWIQSNLMFETIRELYDLGYSDIWPLPEGVMEEWQAILDETNPNQ